ncbi:MAG: hypothetical protein PQJ58_15210 [Spirochaetales bacterium]|nr:hypothetical protein [Spirochaetales bacterium]
MLEGYPLQDVDSWCYEDIRKMNDLLDMRRDYEMAVEAWRNKDDG